MPPKVLTAGALRAWSVYGEINVRGLGSTLALMRVFNLAGTKAGGVAATLVSRIGNLAKVLSFAGLGFAALVVSTTSAFSKFDSAMTQSLAIMNDVSETMRGKMSAAARQVGLTTQFSAEQAAESYFFLASAGFNAEQSLAAMPQVAAFAQAGMFDMATATDLATDAQSALGLKSDDAQENLKNMAIVTDTLVGANTLANATVQQFAESITNKLGGVLKALNKDLFEGTAALAAFADQGVKGRRAGQRLTIVYRDLATVSIKNAKAFRELGVEVWDPATGQMNDLADIIGDLEKSLGDLSPKARTAALDQLGLNKRAADAIRLLIGTSDEMRRYKTELKEMGGITEQVAQKQLGAFRFSMLRAKRQVADLAISIGSELAPTVAGLADTMRQMFADIDPEVAAQNISNMFKAVLRSTGKLLQFLGNMFNNVKLNMGQAAALGVIGFLLLGPMGMAIFPIIGGGIRNLLSKLGRIGARFWGDEDDKLLARIEFLGGEFDRIHRQLQNVKAHPDAFPNSDEMIADYTRELKELSEQMQELSADALEASMETGGFSASMMELGSILEDLGNADLGAFGAGSGALTSQDVPESSVRSIASFIDPAFRAFVLREAENFGSEFDSAIYAPRESDQALDRAAFEHKQRMRQMLSDIGGAASREAKNIGRRIIQGIVDGSLEMKDVLKMVLTGILNVAMGGLFSFLKIGSPSKLMVGVGKNITMSMAQGIRAEKGRLVTAMNELGAVVRTGAMSATLPRRMLGAVPGGVPAAVGPGGALSGPSGPYEFDFKNMPRPMTPREAARDSMWQEVLRESIRKADQDGFKLRRFGRN